MNDQPNAPAAIRNRNAILRVLRDELESSSRVLEIGSGTGQHAVYFGEQLPHLIWQTSDLQHNHAGIRSWLDAAGLKNVLYPIALDVSLEPVIQTKPDAIFSANTAHIMAASSVVDMLSLAGRELADDGRFLLYGPFRIDGEFTSDSNRDFDSSLRRQNSAMGIRDLEWLFDEAAPFGLSRTRMYAMPANNLMVVMTKRTERNADGNS